MKKLLCCLMVILPTSVFAQNDLQANVNLQFRFKNPGARAQAMGGAFIGLADDTTAIFANPAGLTQITGTTMALELSHNRVDNPIPFFGGRIQQVGLQDFRFDLEERDFPKDVTGIPFLGYVRADARLKWGVYYSELIDFERSFNTEGVAVPSFPGGRDVVDNTFTFFLPSRNNVALKLQTLGFSFAGKLTNWISAGLTLGYNDFEYQGQTTLQIPDLEALFPEIPFDPAAIEALRPFIGDPIAIAEVSGEDQQMSVYAGILLTPGDRFSVGLAYKQQPRFDYGYTLRDQDSNFEPFETGVSVFNMPDSYGVGFAFRPSDAFLISVEVNRMVYSELSDDFSSFFRNENDPAAASQVADDGTEYRAGMEYLILSTRFPLALRAGYWLEPYHALRNTTTDTQLLFRYADNAGDLVQGIRPTAFLQQFAEDENHLTFGLGVTFGNHFTMDFSGDLGDTTQVWSLSGIYRF